MEPGGSMPHSQGLSNNSYPEPNQPNYLHWYLSLQGPFYYCPPIYTDDIRTIERNADVLLNACKDIGVAVNTGKTEYMEIGRHREGGNAFKILTSKQAYRKEIFRKA